MECTPKWIAWEITRRCNLNCVHCRSSSQLEAAGHPDCSLAEAKRVLDEIHSYASPVMVLSGGEPLLRPDVFDIASYGTSLGLRTWDMQNPFPEEANRVIAGKLARWHFAPTEGSRQNLLKEGVPDSEIIVTGNTVIDALLMTAARDLELSVPLDSSKRLVLVTSHRRENFGEPFRNICRALRSLAESNPTVQFLYPVHPNPNVKDVAYEFLARLPNFTLCEPLDYAPFIAAMKRAYLILTDSGGVQEEAPALGKPVLVLRDETERPEAVEQGVVKLVGPNYDRIVEEAQRLLDDETAYKAMARGVSPYGDGHAAERIVKTLREHFT